MKKLLLLVLSSLVLTSCDNEKTLQEYYVDHQGDNQFIAFDIPSSLLTGDNSKLTPEQKATLETVKKINILGFPKKGDSLQQEYEAEKQKLTEILQGEDYIQLMRYGGNGRKVSLYYVGEDDAIDEIIVFGADEEKGFGIARVTGEDMDPEAMLKLLKSLEQGDLDLEGLPSLGGFKD